MLLPLPSLRLLTVAVALVALGALPAAAEEGAPVAPEPAPEGAFVHGHFGRPFLSELHSTISKIEIGYNKSYDEYNLNEDATAATRPEMEIHFGVELPLYTTHFGDLRPDGRSAWSFTMSLPLSVHVLEDMFEPTTAPVIDADYRFGLPRLSLIHRFPKGGWLDNISFTWLPGFHECTHLGDEVVIYRKDTQLPITRLNVSYEYTELQVTVNDPDGRSGNIHTARAGVMFRLSDRDYGWFGISEDDTSGDFDIAHSDRRFEYFLAYQFQRTTGFLASPTARNIFSVELRNRVRYGVPRFKAADGGGWDTIEVRETMMLSLNAYVGWRFHPDPADDQAVGFFIHAFRGLNPYGQLRNYPGYGFVGFSITYEP
ncbi:MAG: hypothetical protein EP329_23735 [Deltaproteobacteria bacterium]|nr:MAG: hypothetical protein EP329_23735 [Deltaproteobacteria bacterium]